MPESRFVVFPTGSEPVSRPIAIQAYYNVAVAAEDADVAE